MPVFIYQVLEFGRERQLRTDALSGLSGSDLAIFEKITQCVECALSRSRMLSGNDLDSSAPAGDLKHTNEQSFPLSRQLLRSGLLRRLLDGTGDNKLIFRCEAVFETAAFA